KKRLDLLGGLSLETLEEHMREISKGINESLASSHQDVHRVETQLVGCFRSFAQAWPEESGDFTAS
ncbi:hypothetical protein, partial [Stenotrophomonas sp. SrG]|uniref:hypothetical protein n=1 Tax=Stenotrophomonas sp. SrG TaxID=3414430 RepID=UPI003CECA3D8